MKKFFSLFIFMGFSGIFAFSPLVKMLDVSSESFEDGESIPSIYTCDGKNISPHLSWRLKHISERVMSTIKSWVVICDDIDAPGGRIFVHWVMWNIPAEKMSLPEGFGKNGEVDLGDGIMQGENDFSKENIGYSGPCPPRGHGVHRYRFTVYGLKKTLRFPQDTVGTKSVLLEAMEGCVVARGRLVGKYEREPERATRLRKKAR